MADVDYGYGDAQPDYGYGDSAPSTSNPYGYGDSQPDYGYGESKPTSEVDYGYGDSQPDYGYGDSAPSGNSNPYGYGDDAPQEPKKEKMARRMTKRRCSVTKYSLEVAAQDSNNVEAQEMAQNLQAAEMVERFRNGGMVSDIPHNTTSVQEETFQTEEAGHDDHHDKKKEKGVLRGIRKRLSGPFGGP